MIEKSRFTVQWKIIYRLHKYSMSPSTSQQDIGINIYFIHFYITIKFMGKNESEDKNTILEYNHSYCHMRYSVTLNSKEH